MQKFLKKVHFLKKVALENLHGFTGRQIFLVQKLHLMDLWLSASLKKIVRFVSKIENLMCWNWVSCSKPHRTSQNDLFRILAEHCLVNIWVPANLFRPDPINDFLSCKKLIFSTVFSPFLNFKISTWLRTFEIVKNWLGYETNDYGIHM